MGLLRQIEDRVIAQPFGDRSGVVIEPFLTDQWYVDAKTLAIPAIAAVEDGRTVFEPRNWEKTYFEWMRNIQPWCISRQLWWGHRIPAWYGPDGHIFVGMDDAEASAQARAHYGRDEPLRQDRGRARHLVLPPPCGRSPPWVGRNGPRTCNGSIRRTPWSPGLTSSSSGSPG